MSIKTICVAGMVILDNQNRILLQNRTDDSNWCIPGGGMELGETVQETAVRETLEETGLKVNKSKLYNIYSGKNQYHKYPDGNEYYFVNVVFIAECYEGAFMIDQCETKELKYFELHNLPNNVSKTNLPILKDLRDTYLNASMTKSILE